MAPKEKVPEQGRVHGHDRLTVQLFFHLLHELTTGL